MMTLLNSVTVCALTASFLVTTSTKLSGEELTVDAAKLGLDISRSNAQQPLQDLQEKYEGALARIEEEQQSRGNLDALLILREERESFRERKTPPEESSLPALNNLREIYQRELGPVEERRQREEAAAFATFRKDLEAVIAQLTRAGKVEEALAARETLANVEKELGNSEAPSESKEVVVLGKEENFVATTQLKMETKDNLYVLSSDQNSGQFIRSKDTFKTPFTIHARAMTDGGNLRFYFGQRGVVIFNWEMNPRDLRINEPVGSLTHGVRNSTPLDPDRLYDLRIQVTDAKLGVYVGRRKYAEIDGDFSEAEGTVGIGPAFGSTISIESLVVTRDQLEEAR